MDMPENIMNHFLVISGHISVNKRKEFEQTFRLAFSTISSDCLDYSLSCDTNKEGEYYFLSTWITENAMKQFMGSMEYQLMNGAFYALGSINKKLNGPVFESQSFISGR